MNLIMNIHQHCTMYKSNLKMQKYRRTIFQNCTKISNLSNFNRDILNNPFLDTQWNKKRKKKQKESYHFSPLQSSILRRKTQITNPPTSHLNSNFIPNKISPIPRNEIDEKARTKKKKSLAITVLSSRFPIFIKTQIAITAQL